MTLRVSHTNAEERRNAVIERERERERKRERQRDRKRERVNTATPKKLCVKRVYFLLLVISLRLLLKLQNHDKTS